MIEIYSLMFVTGLLGGFGHCIGMCGPVVIAYSVSIGYKSFIPHLLYNAGRISTYTILGGVMGLTGSFIMISGQIQQVQKAVMMAAGAVIVIMGLSLTGWFPVLKYLENKLSSLPFFQKIMKLFSGDMGVGTFYPMGLVLGLLPCGLVYTALLSAARLGMEAGSPVLGLLRGAVLLLSFGIGTAPSLLLFSKVAGMLSVKLRDRLHTLSAIVVISMGLLFIARAFR
jgi:sulfite exporter TauE/SafE